VRCVNRIGQEVQVSMHAGPPIFLGRNDYRGADRIEFDVSGYGQEVAIGVDQAGFKASFPQSAGAPVATVEGVYMALMKLAHGTRDRPRLRRTGKQMNMVSHQNIGM
jgi:hypothetical protein